MSRLEMIITARERDLGGFSVRRILPYASHRMVGPFIFFDHMGPAAFQPGQGMDVRPHPHINLATVTYLFEGVIQHRDSLGNNQLIEPGAINWMTAGRGIVHSERTPSHARAKGIRLNGIQLWVALPEEAEETEPSFTHHPSHTMPSFEVNGVACKLLLGRAFGHTSPVKLHSDLFYMEALMPAGSEFIVLSEERESAAYVVDGQVRVEGESVNSGSMAIAKGTSSLTLQALEDSRLMLLGGKPVGKRHIFWNFVSSSEERLEQAKREWRQGPGKSARFAEIPDDNSEFIPLPADTPAPKGTPL